MPATRGPGRADRATLAARSAGRRRPRSSCARVCYDRRVRASLAALVMMVAPAAIGAEPASPAPASGELHHAVVTRQPRDKLSAYLIAPAEKAAKAGDWARAIPLYLALAAARGPASAEQQQLARLWTLAGQNPEAAEAWTVFAHATGDRAARADALAEAARLTAATDPFAKKLALAALVPQARQAFARGRAAFGKQHYGDALVYFHIGHALAPDLPGFLRELGATYDKLDAPERKREFYRRYLVHRPFGANAEAVRGELARDRDALGTLLVSTSLPCTELWINRQRVTTKLPEAGLAVAPGEYKGLCYSPKYEMALFEYATVEAGKPASLTFRWAIVVNQLQRPFGRIALENPKTAGMMIDLGITSPEVGVAVPADGRKLKMVLVDDAGVKREERSVRIEPGQRHVVTW
jgi:tetratricopeptide (TPR) repeat protein